MKKLFLLLTFILISSLAMAEQNEAQERVDLINDIHNIDFYGVDFSDVKTFGAAESPAKFALAFKAINDLLINERSKYNLEKYLYKDSVALHIRHLSPSYTKIADENSLALEDSNYKLDRQSIEKLVQGYDVEYKYEIGAVLIAEILNKDGGYAIYHLVFFDNETKNIIASYPIKSKVGGFGLRNFWAKSVRSAMVQAKEHIW